MSRVFTTIILAAVLVEGALRGQQGLDATDSVSLSKLTQACTQPPSIATDLLNQYTLGSQSILTLDGASAFSILERCINMPFSRFMM
jgi:hypothetical protein